MAERGTTQERLAAMKAARETKLAEQAKARTEAKASTPSKTSAAELARNKAFAEQQMAESMRGAVNGRPLAGVVGSTIAQWAYDPKTGKERTPQEIIAAVTDAVLADKGGDYGTTLDPLTGQPRPATDVEKVRTAMMNLLGVAKRESGRYLPAQKLFQELGGSVSAGAGDTGRRATSKALINRPDLWVLGKETIGTQVSRQNFGDAYAMSRFVVDPTKNQLTPEQMDFYRKNFGGNTPVTGIDPIT